MYIYHRLKNVVSEKSAMLSSLKKGMERKDKAEAKLVGKMGGPDS